MLAKWNLCLVAVAGLFVSSTAWGQGCGAEFGHYGGHGGTDCGRVISQHDAAALWGNYCNETCFDFRRQRNHRLFGGGCGMGGGCGSCLNSGFGYPADCGGCGNLGGCHGGTEFGGGLLQGGFIGHHHDRGHHRHPFLASLLHRHRGDGCGSQRGCGLFSRLFQHHRNRHSSRGQGRMFRYFHGCDAPGLFGTSAATCGTNGAYFSEGVGYEYGTAGIQSSVQGCGSGTEFQSPAIDSALQSHNAPLDPPTAPNGNDLNLPSANAPLELVD